MALAININDLLNKQKIESNRIEFKKVWNPGSIYHSMLLRKVRKNTFISVVAQVVLRQEVKLSLNCESWLIVCLLMNGVIATFSWKIFP